MNCSINKIELPNVFEEDNSIEWDKIGRFIENQTSPQITLCICGGGGKLHILDRFTKAILAAKQKGTFIIANIFGEAWSSHGFLAAYADLIVFEPHSAIILHHPFIKKTILFGLLTYKDLNLCKSEREITKNLFRQCLSSGLLTRKDINDIIRGKELVISPVEGDIVTKPIIELSPITIKPRGVNRCLF
ncbi:MAG: hypothetical protein PHG08_01120 [Bacilli bacterium]|nr:hypothetical protein [Bacilli bacterium]